MWSAGWVAVRLLCATRVRLIFAGWDRRTMFVVGSRCLGSGVAGPGGGGLLIAESRVPRACRAATDPADGLAMSPGTFTRFG